MYESRQHRPVSRAHFIRRLARHVALAMGIVGVSLVAGMAGYVWFEGLAWDDAFVNSAMLLGGMGPVNAPQTHAGKIFAGLYALYAGLVFLISAGIVAAPVVHRLLHRFHWS